MEGVKPWNPLILMIGGVLVLNLGLLARPEDSAAVGILGGPASEEPLGTGDPALFAVPLAAVSSAMTDEDAAGFLLLDETALQAIENPLSGVLGVRDGLMVYKIQEGDTLSKIAAHFGVSTDTLRWTNEGLRSQALQIGQELVVLPVSGVVHRVQEGETPESIAALYGVPSEAVMNINKSFEAGASVIVAGGKPLRGVSYVASKLPDLGSYFMKPVNGWNWGRLHETNAVDIANACSTPILAAAEGLVEEIGSPRSWNDGYGGYVKIKHPVAAEVYTLYAHTSENLVKEGDYVARGDLIAKIGNTGNVHGPTGCHLHFEVRNARNPLAK
ncbi:MAG: hypothetical protein A3G64_03175 [Candidatus Liptonbacteria bacterium RIFCSPLOWO2_12_FULL_60_15]|uniref:LysM domain-containing protein n=1 Tax=Candidatus Liptonbacteria bacterium RIFCSPLOWO2_12_FULL_60_15 TaxID=1798653 RepID=A0A1G2CLB9_9BACT|nr:MAG: hypothetical protein A3G64_03175 [Candidatus Liptonbacteria bacterium RIFCSPLOWO2_12_FULL_60_15]